MQAFVKSHELGKPMKFFNLKLNKTTKIVLSVGFGLLSYNEVKNYLGRSAE